MTRLSLPSNATLAQGERRLDGANLFLPQISASGVDLTTSSRPNLTLTASATPHTVGPWVQAVAATTDTIEWVELTLTAPTFVSGNQQTVLVNIGIGGSGSEVIVVPAIQMGWGNNGMRYRVPCHIPIGSRVSLQCQSNTVSKSFSLSVTFGSSIYGKSSPSTLIAMGGPNLLTTSKGVNLPAAGTINTKTAWTSIIASTAVPFGALFVGVGGGTDTSLPAGSFLVDIGIGSTGNEVPIISNICYITSATEYITPTCNPLFPCNIPLGTQLSARWAFSDNTGGCDVILLGVPRV
jgi:hypothetical protein